MQQSGGSRPGASAPRQPALVGFTLACKYRRMTARRYIAGALVVPLLACAVAAAVLLQSEARASALCGREGFSVASPSWWPPGATCRGGEPSFEITMLDPLYVFVLIALGLGLYGAHAVARPRFAGQAQRRNAR